MEKIKKGAKRVCIEYEFETADSGLSGLVGESMCVCAYVFSLLYCGSRGCGAR